MSLKYIETGVLLLLRTAGLKGLVSLGKVLRCTQFVVLSTHTNSYQNSVIYAILYRKKMGS